MSERTITLNGFPYKIKQPLGTPGFVARAELAEAAYSGRRPEVVLKSLATPNQSDKLKQMEAEATVLKRLNEAEAPGWGALRDASERFQKAEETLHQRVIIANFDAGLADDGKYYLVQEKAPAEEIDLEKGVADLASELRALRLAEKTAQAVGVAHASGLSLKDFVPQSKIDRLHIDWAGDRFHINHLKVIDWNITGDASEQPNDIVFLGSLIFALLTGFYAPLNQTGDKWDYAAFRPAELAKEEWGRLSAATRLLVERLVNPLPAQRLSRASSIREELQWLIDLLQQTEVSPARWGELIEAQRQNPYRIIAIVATAKANTHDLRDLPQRFQNDLNDAEQQANKKLEFGQARLLRDVRSDLNEQIYSGALDRLHEVLPTLDPATENVRQAYYLKQQALLGLALNEKSAGTDYDHQLAREIAHALINKDWSGARDKWRALSDVAKEVEAARALNAVIEWRANVQSIEREIEAEHLPVETPDASGQLEEARLKRLDNIKARLTAWHTLAPFEFDLKSQVSLLESEIDNRRKLLTGLQQVRQTLVSGNADRALAECKELLNRQRNDPRVLALQASAQAQARAGQAKQEMSAALQQVSMHLDKGEYKPALELARSLRVLPAELKDKGLDDEWPAAAQELDLEATIKTTQELVERFQTTSRDLTQYTTILAEIKVDTLPRADLEFSGPEQRCLELIENSAQWAVAARRAHEQQRLLIFALLDQVKRLEEHGYTLRQQLIERRLGDIDQALDAFGQNDLQISAFMEKLRGCQPAADLTKRLDERAKRLTDLRTLREGTQQGLDNSAPIETIKPFEQVAASPTVATLQRADIQRLIDLWRGFQNSPDNPPVMPDIWEASAPWPGSDTLLTRMRDQVGQYLIGLADQQQRAGNPESASEYYRKAARYCKFTETQLAQQREVDRQIKRLQQERANWEVVREQIEENLIYLTNSSDEAQPVTQTAWNLLKPYQTPAADSYRTRLRSILEKRVWSELSLDATVDDLDHVSRQLNEIQLITLEARWGTWAMIVTGLREVLLGQSHWATFEGYFNQATRDHGWFNTLARQIADNGQPERLQALLTHYHNAWEHAFERCWQEAYIEAKAAVLAERSGAAAGWVEKARALKKNTGLDLPNATERAMDAVGVQAEMLQRRERAIAAANPTQPITLEQLTALQSIQKETGADLLPSHAAYVACVERVQALRLKQVALAWPIDESRHAERLMALRTAQGEGGKLIGETTAYWSARLKAYDQLLAQLNSQIKDNLQKTQQELRDLTEGAVKDAATTIQTGKPETGLVQRATNLIWQLAWLAENINPTSPLATSDAVIAVDDDRQPAKNGPPELSLTEEVAGRITTLKESLTETRDHAILNCHDRASYEQAKQKFIELEQTERQIKTQPKGVPLPDRRKSDTTELDFFNLPTDWQPATLEQLTLSGLSWTDLNGQWRQLGEPLKFDSAATAAIELVKRVAVFDTVLKGLPSDGQSLSKARAALDQAQHIAAAAHKAQSLAATDPSGALAETKDFPREPVEPLRDADWLWVEPRWIDGQMQLARQSIEAAILPKVQFHFKKVSTAAENLHRDILPLMQTSERGTVEFALLEGAREASADHLKNGRQSDALKVWSIIETLGKDTNSARLKKEGRARSNQLSGRRRMLLALGGVGAAALTIILFVVFKSQNDLRQAQLVAQQTAVAAQAQSTTDAATKQAQLSAIQTATAGCEQLEFAILNSPGSQTVPDSKVTLTWRVRNTSTAEACNWDKPGWQLLASDNTPRKNLYVVTLTKVPGQSNEYDLSLTAELEAGQSHLVGWQLNKPGTNNVPQGPVLQAEVMVATPTNTSTPTETLTPTPTDTPTPSITPTSTMTRTPLPPCPGGQTRVKGVCTPWTPIPVPDTPTPAPNCHEESYQCNCQQVTDPVTGDKQKVCETCTRTVCQ